MLEWLKLKHVGPAPRIEMELAERLTILTGDNGLGKTFILDVAWWALSRTRASYPAWPQRGRGIQPAIEYHVRADPAHSRDTRAARPRVDRARFRRGARQADPLPPRRAWSGADRGCALMRGDFQALPEGLATEEQIHNELLRVLAGHDPFWPRWIVSREASQAAKGARRTRS